MPNFDKKVIKPVLENELLLESRFGHILASFSCQNAVKFGYIAERLPKGAKMEPVGTLNFTPWGSEGIQSESKRMTQTPLGL